MKVLAEVRRGDRVESVHHGWAVVMNAHGSVLYEIPGAPSIFVRSAAKPFQALPLVRSGAFDALGLDDSHLALCCASHAGEPPHQEGVARILQHVGLTPHHLRCGAHRPLADACAPATSLANNCSGKHAGMLTTCVHSGWDVATYTDPTHPLQHEIARGIEQLGETRLACAIDGCSVPTWYMPLASLALAYARLPGDPAGKRIAAAMGAHPVMVSGTGRRDTRLMQVTGGRVLSKGGAEGVAAGCLPELGIGFAVKIADGNARAVGPVLVTLLRRLGLLHDHEYEELLPLTRSMLTNHAGLDVGEIVPAF